MKNLGILIRKENAGLDNEYYFDIASVNNLNIIFLNEDDRESCLYEKLRRCDGLIITGGFKKVMYDDILISYALDNNLPLLGICQGMQSMAIFKSDDLIVPIGNKNHKQEEGYRHRVSINDSNLKNILLKDIIDVNTHHIETVKRSTYFKEVAYSDDGLLEAVENPCHKFQIGVQWHPEKMVSYDKVSRLLLKTFADIIKEN